MRYHHKIRSIKHEYIRPTGHRSSFKQHQQPSIHSKQLINFRVKCLSPFLFFFTLWSFIFSIANVLSCNVYFGAAKTNVRKNDAAILQMATQTELMPFILFYFGERSRVRSHLSKSTVACRCHSFCFDMCIIIVAAAAAAVDPAFVCFIYCLHSPHISDDSERHFFLLSVDGLLSAPAPASQIIFRLFGVLQPREKNEKINANSC